MKYAGAGANGCVMLAKDTQNGGVEVAIKVSKKPGNLKGWQDECRRAQRLHRTACSKGEEALKLAERYLPTCLDVGGTDQAPFIIMHAAEGKGIGSMASKLPKGDRASFFAQSVGAVTAMHGIGFSHNDLHNENVEILYGSSTLVLIDFGEVVPHA